MSEEISTSNDLSYQFRPAKNGVLQFAVKATNDAHIALTAGPEVANPMYEVFFGGWENSKSVIRKNGTKPDVAEAETRDILSGNEFRRFWVKWQNGTISAGKADDPTPILSFTDSEDVPIGYFGICTGWGATGEWIIEGIPQRVPTRDCGDFLTYTLYPILQGFLEFEVKASSNAHVVLTTGPKETDPMYEIVLGGWQNTASSIQYRRGSDNKTMVHESTPGLLNGGEFRHFSIEWRNGEIRVVHKGRVLLTWTDPAPFGITHYGVRTGEEASGTWRIHKIPLGFNVLALAASDLREESREDEGEEELRETNNDDDGEPEEADGEPDADEEAPPAPALCWEKRGNGELGENAVEGGVDIETGEMLYVARAEHEGALLPGKLVISHGVTYVPWGGGEHGKSEYEVLCGGGVSWVQCQNGEVPPNAFEGGQTEDGETLYIGRINDGDKMCLGKVQPSHKACYVPYGGSELAYPEYEVLVVT